MARLGDRRGDLQVARIGSSFGLAELAGWDWVRNLTIRGGIAGVCLAGGVGWCWVGRCDLVVIAWSVCECSGRGLTATALMFRFDVSIGCFGLMLRFDASFSVRRTLQFLARKLL